MADTDIQGMLVRIEATTAQLRSEIARADSTVAQGAMKIDRSLAQIDDGFDRVGESAKSAGALIRSAMGLAAGAISVKSVIEAADSYSQMSDRIGLATGSFGEYNLVQERLLETAKRTYRPLSEAQELFIRTADSLKSMGKSTGQALDVMDSFSFLLVTNSASADKASSAIDAYSKALQTGKVEADGWQSILAAMPTVVGTLSKATGKSAEEIRSLGAQGKLSLDVLTDGLQKSAEANGKLADSMGVAVRDALQNLSNAFSVYIGQANEATDFTGKLASGISLLGDNFGNLADIALAAATAALAKYGAAAVGSAYSALKDASARKAQAAAVLLAAQAEQQKAQTTVFLAEKEAIAARGTAVQTQMSLQLAEARMAEARATAAAGAAQEVASRASFSLMGVLGGPVGIIALAVGAATAFLALRDNTSDLEKKLGDLADPVDKLAERFNKLNRATQSVTLRELTSKVEDMQDQLRQMSGAIADQFEADMRSMGAAGADGLMAGLVPLPDDAQKALELVRQASANQADGVKVDWKAVADQLRQFPSVTETMARTVEKSQGPVTDFSAELEHQRDILARLTEQTDQHSDAMGRNAARAAEAAAAGQKYLDQQLKQLAASKDKTFLAAANRFIKENADLTDDMAAAIRSAAAARDSQKKADDAAAKAGRKNSSEGESAAKKQLKDFESTEEGYKRQIELINTTGDKQKDATEVAKLSFELQEGKLGKLTEAQKRRLLGMAAELDSLNKLKKANEDALKLESFKAALAVGTKTDVDGYSQELAGIGMGEKARDRMRADLAVRQKYAADVATLNEQRNTGQISTELYASETQALQDAYNQRLLAQQFYYERVDEAEANWLNGAKDAWQDYADYAQNYAAQAADFVSGTLGSATSELGGAFTDIITESKDAGDAVADAAAGMAKSMVGALMDMAAQWLIYGAVQAVVGKSTQSVASLGMVANAQAMSFQAQLAAYASTAAIPLTGPALAPAAAAAAAAATAPMVAGVSTASAMAGAGFMDGGYTGHGRRDEVAGPVHRGEYVFDAEATARIGVGRLEALSDGRIGMAGSSGAAGVAAGESSGMRPIIINAPVTVEAQPGASANDAQRTGEAVSQALERQIMDVMERETQQGGIFWRR
ncbi:tape measure protein [Pseudomonas alkylphenolica]|uniref:Lambda family phage tail tape measure protein n=1 Tax=Pseudomonas alkylphenolica TaxID=237609 RepID=A0A077FAU2_9PSED|nr:tape measure protein [Pseudomonas alkylphenolica]AIL60939.1 Lambda family phage tail tape measure protein [Pseudomonas alkylphenolica]